MSYDESSFLADTQRTMDVLAPFDLYTYINVSDSNQSSPCELDDVRTNRTRFAVLFSFEIGAAIISFIVNSVFLWVLRKVKVMPINVRLLLAHLSLNFMWFSIGTIYKTVSFLSAISNPCSMRTDAYECKIRELPFTLPLNSIFYSLLGICIERLFSTFYHRNRDHGAAPPAMAVLFILIIWTATLANSLYSLPYISRTRIVPVCEASLSLDPSSASVAVSINIVLEILAISVTLAVSIYEQYVAKNIAINRMRYTLSTRFFITQNVEVNALMLPSMVLHVVCYLPNLIFTLLVVFNTPMSISTKWMLIHLSYLWRQFHALGHPMLAFARNFHIKKQFKKTRVWSLMHAAWKRSAARVAVYNNEAVVEATVKAHFEYLEHVWAVTFRQTRQNGS